MVQAVPLTALTLAASPDLFLALRRTYGVLASEKKEAEGNWEMTTGNSSNSSSSRDKQVRIRGFCARFVCRCSLALLNAVVDGLIAHAPAHEEALEALFTLLSQLVQAKGEEEGGEEEAGEERGEEEDDQQAANGKSITSRGLLSDCIQQRNGLMVRLQKFVSAAGCRQGQDLDTSGVAYLVELLKSSVGGPQGESTPRGLFMNPCSHRNEEWGEGGLSKCGSRGPEVKAMVQEVRQVCPGLGEGFVHACLAVMDYNTNMVVNALLEGSALPYPLDTLDRTLPSPMGVDKHRKKDGGVDEADARDEDFIAHQKAYIRQMERDAEEDAYLLQEYDDDFDDQFQAEGMNFSRDLVREDFESIRKYNNLVKKEEEEDRFWKEMRLEQPGLPKVEDDENEEEGEERQEDTKHGGGFDPDAHRGRPREGGGGKGGIARGRGGGGEERGRGGRGGGRGRGYGGGGLGSDGERGGRSGGTGTTGTGRGAGPLSALARRRKEKQKHLRANHNRKNQAARKAVG